MLLSELMRKLINDVFMWIKMNICIVIWMHIMFVLYYQSALSRCSNIWKQAETNWLSHRYWQIPITDSETPTYTLHLMIYLCYIDRLGGSRSPLFTYQMLGEWTVWCSRDFLNRLIAWFPNKGFHQIYTQIHHGSIL